LQVALPHHDFARQQFSQFISSKQQLSNVKSRFTCKS